MTATTSRDGADAVVVPIVTLDTTTVQAEPGGQAQISVKVRNPGRLVESFSIDVVGLDAGWWQVHPPELAVYPGKEETALVVLTPPARAESPDTPLPFGVRAVSTLDAQHSAVEEADLEVGRVSLLQTAIEPVTSRARWTGHHRVRFTNWGNSPVQLRLTATDKDQRLGFRITPETIEVPVGGTAGAKVRVRPRTPFLRGAPVHLPFQVIGETPGVASPPPAYPGAPDPSRPTIDAAVLQRPVLSRGVIVLLALLVAGIAALVALAMRTNVVGATQGDIAPPPPTRIEAEAVGAELVNLSWDASDLATGYRVQPIDANSKKRLALIEVPAGANTMDVPAKPSSRACFSVLAVRNAAVGTPSKPKCVTTSDGKLAAPTNVNATPPAQGVSQVTWQGDEANQHVVLLDGSKVGEAEAGIFQLPITITKPGKLCVQVIAKQGESQSSPPSNPPFCFTVAADANGGVAGGPATNGTGENGTQPSPTVSATPDPTAAASPGTATGDILSSWVAWVGQVNQQNDQVAKGTVQKLQAKGFTLIIVPGSRVDPTFLDPAVVTVANNFNTQQEAQTFCDQIAAAGFEDECQPIQPTQPAGQ